VALPVAALSPAGWLVLAGALALGWSLESLAVALLAVAAVDVDVWTASEADDWTLPAWACGALAALLGLLGLADVDTVWVRPRARDAPPLLDLLVTPVALVPAARELCFADTDRATPRPAAAELLLMLLAWLPR
jgi:hypothetical protein